MSELSPAEMLATAKDYFKPSPCPTLPWLTDAELLAALALPDGPAEVAALFKEREERIFLASDEGDPFYYGFELPHWKDCDRLQAQNDLVYCAGGKRASKSERAAKRVVQAALKYPKGVIWCFQDNHATSIATQQKLIWKYLPNGIKALNGKQDRRKTFAVNYTLKNGFSDGVLVLPNKTAIHFLTYNSEVTDYQGWEIGAYVKREDLDPNIANLGAWADENMPLKWMETITFRATTRSAKVIWTFSTTEGITTTIKEVLGVPVTLKTRPAELLVERINVTGLPKGHMPYIQQCGRPKTAAIYFHSAMNTFGENYENVKQLCIGKPSAYIEENAYGYARDVMNKAFPKFGSWNIIKREHLPAKLTRYMLTDPGDASRSWATLWVGVNERGWHYIYRDWPDAQTYGEWAVPSDDTKQPDGERGPAQRDLGWGIKKLCETWLTLEEKLKETIFQRYIDPRAASNPHIEDEGGTNLYHKFAEQDPPMLFQPWPGAKIKQGFTHVNDLLDWNQEQELCAPINCPRLYVCEGCEQVIWMMSNYTGLGGERAGGKDFADLVRGMALADLQYYESNEFKTLGGSGGY